MNLCPNRASHPGYIDTGGPPREPVTPGAKRKKEPAKAKKEKKKAKAFKKIATIEKANTVAYANDETPRSTQMSHASGRKKSKAQGLGEYRTVSPFEPASELTSMGTDTKNTDASVRNADRDQPHESHIPSIEGSELPTDLEHTIKKKSKGKANVRKYIEELKEGDKEEDSSPQESPVIMRTKRFRTEAVRTLPDSWPWQLD